MRLTSPSSRMLILACSPAVWAAEPILTTPGTATWETVVTETGNRTIFTISDDTVLEWAEFELDQGSEMFFDFIGGTKVVNYLTGDGYYGIEGSITSNGSVAFFAPQGHLDFKGSITAKEVTLSTLDVDADDFLDNNGYSLGDGAGNNYLTVDGRVDATDGDVIFAGQGVVVQPRALVTASGSVRMAGAGAIKVSASGSQRITDVSDDGFVLHMGETHASRIEVSTGKEFINGGTIDASKGRLFIEVGKGGKVFNNRNALLVGEMVFSGEILETPSAGFDEADAPVAVNDSTLKIPTLRRPNGQQMTASTEIRTTTAVSASSAVREGRSQERKPASSSLMARSSFFGMRGGRGGSAEPASAKKKQ